MKIFRNYIALFSFLILISACSKERSLEFGNYRPADIPMAWEFRDSVNFYKGSFDTVYLQSQGSLQALTLEGRSEDGTDAIFIQLIGDPLQAGVYSVDQGIFEYTIDGILAYSSGFGIGNDFSITVSEFDSAGVKASFGGILQNGAGDLAEISDGRFSANFNPEGTDEPLERGEAIPTCENIVANGTYTKGEELTDGNFLTIPVSVITPGTWSVLSEEDNGMVVFGEGEVKEGDTEIIVYVIGTPTEAVESIFEISLGPIVCHTTINITGTEDPLVEGQAGSLKRQERIPSEPAVDNMMYWEPNQKIGEISSDKNPMRKILYNGENLIDRVDYYIDMGLGNFQVDARTKYRYHNDGNLFTILDMLDNNFLDTLMTYYWNADNTLSRRVSFSGGDVEAVYDYEYSNGNLTGININNRGTTSSVTITYDDRENKFSTLPSQYYFLDMAPVFDGSDIHEIFYFSEKYPVSISYSNGSVEAVDVVVNPSLRPLEIKIEGQTVYKYVYN